MSEAYDWESAMAELVESVDDIADNVREFWEGVIRDPQFFGRLAVAGLHYVVLADGTELKFGPSRYVGYKNNSKERHRRNQQKDGRETNPAIDALLKASKEDLEAEEALSLFCEENNLVLHDKPRKYWRVGGDSYFDPTRRTDLDDPKQAAQLPATTRKAMINARLGQGGFRKALLLTWKRRCAVTGCAIVEALRASHIKPWAESSDSERLDPANGLLLVGTLDALFDSGLVTFTKSGSMMRARQLSARHWQSLGLQEWRCLRSKPNEKTVAFLEWHRKHHHHLQHEPV